MKKINKSQEEIIVGRNPVIEALKGGIIIEKIYFQYGVHGSSIEKIRLLARKKNIPTVELNQIKFREIAGDNVNQGVSAKIGIKEFVEVDDILNVALNKNEPPLIVILDEIQDPQNLGAIIRTAECAGVHGLIIPKHHAATITSTVVKTSAGAAEYFPLARVTNISNTIEFLKDKGVWIVGTDSSAEKNFSDIDYSLPVAIVIGSEGKGIRRLVKEKCDFLVKIPLYGKIESLNASVAAGLIIYEAVKKRKDF